MLKVRSTLISVTLLATLSIFPMATSQADNSGKKENSHKVVYPNREKAAKTPQPSPSKAGGVGTVSYHAGGTIIEKPKAYVIWYGSWDPNSCNPTSGSNSTASIIGDLVKNLGASSWNEINATYYQVREGEKTFVSPSIRYSGCTVDSGSQGLTLDGATGPQISDVVKNAIGRNAFPNDPSGVYIVLTSANVSVDGFLTDFCGYHDSFANGSVTIKYSFIGDASASANSCVAQTVISPNGNTIADGMANVLAHELIEPISDPLGLSWFDDIGLENADKCAWTWGNPVKAADGSFSNMTIGDRKFLIQQNVPANTNICVSSLPGRGNFGSGRDK